MVIHCRVLLFKKGHFMSTIKRGNRYNKLVAVKFHHRDKKSELYWLFKCDCGNEKVILVSSVKRGDTKACGCLNRIHGMTKTKTHKSWTGMRARCLNKNNSNYKNYGGRGITVCDRWLKGFENFYKDMDECPKGKSLDRIDNDGNYEPKNCRWATPKEQSNNSRFNRFLTCNGKTQNITQWAEELNINYSTLYSRLKRGWNIEKVLRQ